MKAWQDETRVALRKLAPTRTRGTFAADARAYTGGGVSERLWLAVSEFDRMPAGSKTAGSDGWQSTQKVKKTA